MFASIVSCQSWPAVTTAHWTVLALWNASIVLAICSILTGAQQTLVLGPGEPVRELTATEIQEMRLSLASRGSKGRRDPSAFAVFSWQVPVMLLCYCVLCFLAGLCSVVYGPLARKLRWDADSKVSPG